MLGDKLANCCRELLFFQIFTLAPAVNSLNILMVYVKSCRHIAVSRHVTNKHTIKRLATMKRRENNRTASSSLKVTSKDTNPLHVTKSLCFSRLFELAILQSETKNDRKRIINNS